MEKFNTGDIVYVDTRIKAKIMRVQGNYYIVKMVNRDGAAFGASAHRLISEETYLKKYAKENEKRDAPIIRAPLGH